jgi:hypothetical protein
VSSTATTYLQATPSTMSTQVLPAIPTKILTFLVDVGRSAFRFVRFYCSNGGFVLVMFLRGAAII